jgi:hypothetical protein
MQEHNTQEEKINYIYQTLQKQESRRNWAMAAKW